jgi:hypothetical protein
MTEEWKKLNCEEVHNLNCSVHIVMVIKLRRMQSRGNEWKIKIGNTGEKNRLGRHR